MGLFKNKEPTVLIRVTDFERRIIITALRNLRDKQIKKIRIMIILNRLWTRQQ